MARKTTEAPSAVETDARPAFRVGAGIFLSRLAGFVREVALAFFFGTSPVADAWRAALRTPNVIQNLLGEGTLSASFIPVYAEFLEEGREEDAGRFAGAALGLLATAAFSTALLGILLAPLFIPLFFPEFEPWQQDLTVTLVRILFLMTAILAVSAWALGILNSHRRFFVSYVAPVLWNGALVVTMVVFGAWLGWDQVDLVVALAWGGVLGALLQVLIQLPWVVPVLKGFRLSVSRKVEGVQEAIRNFGPVVAARGVVNLSGWLDMILAGLLASGALAMIGFAQTLYMLPISLFGMAVAASELPELSRSRHEVERVLRPRVRQALERVAFFLIPSVFAFLVLGDLFVAALFEYGEFGRASTAVTYAVLGAFSLGILASARSRALSSAYYAVRDTRTPAVIAFARVVVSAGVGAALMFPLDDLTFSAGGGTRHFGAVGLGLGFAVGAWLEYGLLRRRLGRAIGEHGPRGGRMVRMLMAGAVAAGVGVGAKVLLGAAVPRHVGFLATFVSPGSWQYHPLLAAGTALVFGVSYLGVAAALGVGIPLESLRRRTP